MVTDVRQSEVDEEVGEGREVVSWRERNGERAELGAEEEDEAAELVERDVERCREGKRLAMVEAENGAGWLSVAGVSVVLLAGVEVVDAEVEAPLISSGREKGGG